MLDDNVKRLLEETAKDRYESGAYCPRDQILEAYADFMNDSKTSNLTPEQISDTDLHLFKCDACRSFTSLIYQGLQEI